MDYRYKPGDKVRIRADLKNNKTYAMLSGPRQISTKKVVMSSMVRMAGKEMEIEKYYCNCYMLYNSNWLWTDEMFDDLSLPMSCVSLL